MVIPLFFIKLFLSYLFQNVGQSKGWDSSKYLFIDLLQERVNLYKQEKFKELNRDFRVKFLHPTS
jgi:hypothetical protein